MNRTILHSDCNCFYASVELLHHPELRGKPVAVGGDPEARHGIVLTADYTAKRCEDRHGFMAGKTGLSGYYISSSKNGSVPEIFQNGPGDIRRVYR